MLYIHRKCFLTQHLITYRDVGLFAFTKEFILEDKRELQNFLIFSTLELYLAHTLLKVIERMHLSVHEAVFKKTIAFSRPQLPPTKVGKTLAFPMAPSVGREGSHIRG